MVQTAHPPKGAPPAYTARSSDTESARGLHTCTCMPSWLRSITGGSPSGEVAVHCARKLSLGCIPLVSRLEGDVGGSVVDDREGAHPEVVPAAAQVAELSGSCSPKVSHKCSMSMSGALLNNQQLARVRYGPPKTTNPWPCATEAMHCKGSAA